MSRPESIRIQEERGLVTIELNRPEVHHALHIPMIRELSSAFRDLDRKSSTRIILLKSDGPNFCAGADLGWMKEGMHQTRRELEEESRELAGLFRQIRESSSTVLTALQGKVLGGAIGLAAAADLVLAEEDSRFAFSEVRLGLIPATIAPFVTGKIGKSRAAAWMISGRPFTAREAFSAGLVHFLCPSGTIREETRRMTGELLSNGPEAMAGIKQMMRKGWAGKSPGEIQNETAALIAAFRVSGEGQEGMSAFFEKRKPRWNDHP